MISIEERLPDVSPRGLVWTEAGSVITGSGSRSARLIIHWQQAARTVLSTKDFLAPVQHWVPARIGGAAGKTSSDGR